MAHNVHLFDHPLVQHKLTLLRKKETSTTSFRRLLSEIGSLMAYEVTRDVSLHEIVIATLPDGRMGCDVLVTGGRIVDVAPRISAAAPHVLDAHGYLLSPPFVDAHFHMDSTLSYGLPRVNGSGTLLEGIALWGELKPLLTQEAVVERALRYCDLAVSQGLLAVRSHVDICDDRLIAVDALLHVKAQVKPYLDLQLVAFPQDGYYRSPTAARNLDRALDLG